MAPSYRMLEYADEIDQTTKWWHDYPTWAFSHFIRRKDPFDAFYQDIYERHCRLKFSDMARPQKALEGYMTDVFERPRRLARSASYANLTYIRDCDHELPIRRAPSVSNLAPSLALPQDYRVPTRYLSSSRIYKPSTDRWYLDSYGPSRFVDTHREVRRPLRKMEMLPWERASHVPYYSFETRRIYFDARMANLRSYTRGSMKYLDRYVTARLKNDDFAARFVHTSYDYGRPEYHRFNRHLMLGSQVAVIQAAGNPHYYRSAWHDRRMKKFNDKVVWGTGY